MTALEFVALLLGSSVLSTFIKELFDWIKLRRARKDTLEDNQMAKEDKAQTLEQRFDQFCADQRRENYEMRQRLSGVESTLGKLVENTAAGEYIEIRREALGYIKQGFVDPEDRILLQERHTRYVSISHNDGLQNIMDEVGRLRTRAVE